MTASSSIRALPFAVVIAAVCCAAEHQRHTESTVAQPPVQMKEFRVSTWDFHVVPDIDVAKNEVIAVKVSDVRPNSYAARDGLRIGDRLIAVAGIPFVPMKPSSFPGLRDKMITAGEVTFSGPRGLFRRQTEITIRTRPKVEEPNKRTTDSSAIVAK